jgi:hypothetical protein
VAAFVRTLLDDLRDRAGCARTQLDLLEHELDALIDPDALTQAAIAGGALELLCGRLDELIADQKEALA